MKFTSFARLFGTGRRQRTRRGRRPAAASLRKRDWFVHPRLENLEDRTVLSVLPTPQVINSGVIATGGMNGNLNSSVVAVDPLDPNDVVSVFSLHDETVTGNQKSFIEGR